MQRHSRGSVCVLEENPQRAVEDPLLWSTRGPPAAPQPPLEARCGWPEDPFRPPPDARPGTLRRSLPPEQPPPRPATSALSSRALESHVSLLPANPSGGKRRSE